jgi:O-acetyl-ADP-ribose deacetylase (regulator of RNase III)
MRTEITIKGATLSLIRGDITAEKVDAIVNAANSSLMGGGGVDGAIHRAGGPAILEECKVIVARQGRLPAGKAVITTGGRLPAKYVIHTVGPVWRGGNSNEAATLAGCYTESLKIAAEKKLRSIAFPAISTGVYGYPLEAAADVAIGAVVGYLKNNDTSLESVHLVLFDNAAHGVYSSLISRMNS